jgi:hypothetical protein
MKKIWWHIPGNCRLIFIIFGICLSLHLCGQSHSGVDYRKVFGEKYEEAASFFQSNPWISETIAKNRLDPCLTEAVVFPELLRYSFIRDKMEIGGLMTLYVQYGKDYADFSVGRFQIKPSFARQVEMDVKTHPQFRNHPLLKVLNTEETPQARLERVKRLDDPQWQLQYLVWFIKITERKFPGMRWISQEEKLRFLATAYNCGYSHSARYIRAMSAKKLFHTSIFKGTSFCNYSDVSVNYWRECKK